MEIERMLVLSTSHVDSQVAFVFNNEHRAQSLWGPDHWITRIILYPKTEYGWFIYVPDDLVLRDLPESLQACFNAAWAYKCRWIMFDRDGETVDELPVYDW